MKYLKIIESTKDFDPSGHNFECAPCAGTGFTDGYSITCYMCKGSGKDFSMVYWKGDINSLEEYRMARKIYINKVLNYRSFFLKTKMVKV